MHGSTQEYKQTKGCFIVSGDQIYSSPTLVHTSVFKLTLNYM